MRIKYSPHPLLTGHGDVASAYWIEGEVKDGGVQRADGKWLSVDPLGNYDYKDAIAGPYERISVAPDLNVLVVTPRVAVFKIPFVEQ